MVSHSRVAKFSRLLVLYLVFQCQLLGLGHPVSSSRRSLQAIGPRGWELREALEKLDKELYDNAPGPDRPFLTDLKNPCWRGGGSGGGGDAVQCLPYAMVIGGFHCGAASLWAALYKHPLVVKTDVSRWHFWAEFDKTMAGYLAGTAKASAKLVAWRNVTAAAAALAAADGAGGGGAAGVAGGGAGGVAEVGGAAWLASQQRIILDGSSSTFAFYWSPNVRAHRAFVSAMVPCWGGCHKDHREGPERETCLAGCYPLAREADRKVAASIGIPYDDISLPLLISAVYGKRPPKMVVLLRDPVERLYSAYWRYAHYWDKFGRNPEGFETYAREQLSSLLACMARNGSASEVGCLLHFETWGLPEERLYFHADQLLRGVYVIWLERWLKFFDRRDLLVLRSEDYFAHPMRTFQRVLEFMDLDPNAIRYHGRIEKLAKAAAAAGGGQGGGGGGAAAAAAAGAANLRTALKTPEDEGLWEGIRRTLMDAEARYAVNRAAALAEDPDSEAAEREAVRGGAAAGGDDDGSGGVVRPRMPDGIRKELADFYRPYNQRLAALLGDPDFIRGWD